MTDSASAAPHLTPAEFRRRGHAMIDLIASYMERAGDFPVLSRAQPGAIEGALPARAPEQGEPWDEILADVERIIMPGVTHWQSPRFFAFFPANSSGPGILGDLLASGLGVQGMLWATSPACTELETRVLDWLADMIGLPARFTSASAEPRQGGGVIHGTASEATLVALLAARERAVEAGPSGPDAPLDQRRLTAYTSTQAHSSVLKAVRIAGLAPEQLRLIDVDDTLAMKPGALAEAVARDRAAGRIPFFITATIGTTSTTAIDPLRAVGEIARRERLWLHTDAAFAGAACVCPEFRRMIDGVELADSFVFNPHKWLLTNFPCSAFWTSDRRSLTAALAVTPEYLRNAASQSGRVIDYRDWQVPLGRRFNALKLWFVIRHYGVEGLRAHVRAGVRLARRFESLIAGDPARRFEVVTPRTTSLVCFRLTPRPGATAAAEDARNRAVMDAVNASGEAYLTHTVVPLRGADGAAEPRTILRVAVGAPSTTEADIDRLFGAIGRASE